MTASYKGCCGRNDVGAHYCHYLTKLACRAHSLMAAQRNSAVREAEAIARRRLQRPPTHVLPSVLST